MDFDDFNGFQLLGCKNSSMKTCKGNTCYMRHHKNYGFFLFTSGCLNLTYNDLLNINQSQNVGKNIRFRYGNETTICEMTNKTGTCICSNNLCNEVEEAQYFSEYESSLFQSINFDEISHYRYYLPNDPILQDYEMRNKQNNRRKSEKSLVYGSFVTDSGEKKNLFIDIEVSDSKITVNGFDTLIIYIFYLLLYLQIN
uniref:Phlebovirus glycoprotein G2 fusion domain-containing protein n=1 Tax=Parastrongyloides trichosuri TaxID=131310 RepID=A0A0N4ZKK5_PARTI